MTINILRAISKMLEVTEPVDGKVFEARVACAKIMLDEVIKGMEQTPTIPQQVVKYALDTEQVLKDIKKSEKPKPPPGKPYRVVVDSARKISKIEGMELDDLIIIDGKTMKCSQAIGKTFSTVTIP